MCLYSGTWYLLGRGGQRGGLTHTQKRVLYERYWTSELTVCAGLQAALLPLALWPLRRDDVWFHRLEHEPQARRQADVSRLGFCFIYNI